MQTLRELPGYNRLRFDDQLTSFQSLLAHSIERNEGPQNSARKVIAKNPLSPAEIIFAAGARAYDLYTWEPVIQAVMKENVELTSDAIDAGLSPDFNPWNLIMTGSTVAGSNQTKVDAFTIACACWDDQIKKSWQVMTGTSRLPGYFWEIPRYDPEAPKWALDFLKKELRQFTGWLADFTGNKISQDSLSESIRQANLIRQDMAEIDRLVASGGKILPALEYYICQLFLGDYLGDGQELHKGLQALISELKTRNGGKADEKSSYFRLYYMGDETQQFQLFNGIEDYGAVMVGSDVRLSLYYELVKEEGPALENLAEWIWKMPCNMPTPDRVKATIPHIKQQKADGVLINSTTGSRNLPGSERMVKDLIKQELGIPVLSIETSLPRQDIEKVDYLVRAFIEMNIF